MTGQTSNQVIADLLARDLGKRHFSKWTAKEQEEAIRRCGLSSTTSKHYKNNKAGRIALLTHLHSTPLPTEHLPVLRLIADLGLPPSGARSRQQFAYYLLCFMCDQLKFPPWEPIPLITIVPPTVEDLCTSARRLCEERMQPVTTKPNFYRIQAHASLWSQRREKTWPLFMKSGLPMFLKALAAEYVKVTNLVLAHSPKCEPEDLRCDIDSAQFRVDRTKVPALFVTAWNGVGGQLAKFEWNEWRWVLGHLLVSAKRAVAKAVLTQHKDVDVQDEQVYVGDEADARHSYYCVGAVWRSLVRHFSSSKSISEVICNMFVDKITADKLGLPTEEVNSRYYVYLFLFASRIDKYIPHMFSARIAKCIPHTCMFCSTFKSLLYANVAVHDHFNMLIAKYHRVTHRNGRVCVRDRFVLRRVTDCLKEDVKVMRDFAALANPVSFRSEDLSKVFLKYLARVETMIGNEIASQLMRDLRISEVDTLETLRQLKRDRRVQVTKREVDIKADTKADTKTDTKPKKKRKRRKKKGW